MGRNRFLTRMIKANTLLHQNGLTFCAEPDFHLWSVCLFLLGLLILSFGDCVLGFDSKSFHFHFFLCFVWFRKLLCKILFHYCIVLYWAYLDFVIFPALHFDFIRNGFWFVTAIANETDMKYAIYQFVNKCFRML